jgi:hypothetical protein
MYYPGKHIEYYLEYYTYKVKVLIVMSLEASVGITKTLLDNEQKYGYYNVIAIKKSLTRRRDD